MEYVDIIPCDGTNAASAPIPAAALQRTSYDWDEDEASCTWRTPNWISYAVLFDDLESMPSSMISFVWMVMGVYALDEKSRDRLDR
jgi:hypothetical protein